MIFLTSSHYDNPERLVGILGKVSREIISRCRQEIDLEVIFQSHAAEGTWKGICKKMLDATEKRYKTEHPTTAWEQETTNQIFAEVEAFVCEGQQQFGMKNEDEMPSFSGVK
eukprot:gene56097-24998_t